MLCRNLSVLHVRTRCPHPQTLLRRRRQWVTTLAIETSCDDTCVAVLEYGKHDRCDGQKPQASSAILHYHKKETLPDMGRGGIVPVEAAKHHRTKLAAMVQDALRHLPPPTSTEDQYSEPKQKPPDFISVTRGPGMRANLNCGLDTAKGLAVAFGIPLIGVHHMQAHALTPRLINALHVKGGSAFPAPQLAPKFPFLTLLVSGGHTMLLHSRSSINHTILANTMDIAIGDCLDKCGRSILPDSVKSTLTDTAYAKHLSAYAFPDESTFSAYPVPLMRSDEIERPVNDYPWQIQPPLNETRMLAFSYSGYVSHVDKILASRPDMSDTERLALARKALGTAFEHLCARTVIALESLRDQKIHLPALVVSGGVAANNFLRYFLRRMLDARGFDETELIFPPFQVTPLNQEPFDPCTDNAAMIAWAGVEMWRGGWRSALGAQAIQKWSMDPTVDGGIVGVPDCYNQLQDFKTEWTNTSPGLMGVFARALAGLEHKTGIDRSEYLQDLNFLKRRADQRQANQRQAELAQHNQLRDRRSTGVEVKPIDPMSIDSESLEALEDARRFGEKGVETKPSMSVDSESLEALENAFRFGVKHIPGGEHSARSGNA